MPRTGDGIYRRGKAWYLDCRINGQRLIARLGAHIKRNAALELATVKRTAFLKGEEGIRRKKKDIVFTDAADKFMQWVSANRRPRTVRSYQLCVKELKKTFGGSYLSAIGSFAIQRHKHARKHAPVRCNRELEMIRRIFNWCLAQKPPFYEGANPLRKSKDQERPVTFFEESEGRLRYLDQSEETKLLAVTPEPIRSMVVVAIHTGVRLLSEGLTLKWENVDFTRRRLTILSAYAKNKRPRIIPLNAVAFDTLTKLKATATSPFVFEKPDGTPYKSFRTTFEKACAKAGLTDITPHTLRHTFCTRLIDTGADVRTVQDLGGWKTLKMVQRYAHPNERGKIEAIKKLESFHDGIHDSGGTASLAATD